MKIGIVLQPWESVDPDRDSSVSIVLLTKSISDNLKDKGSVTIFSYVNGNQEKEQFDKNGIHYYRINHNKYQEKIVQILQNRQYDGKNENPRIPYYFNILYHAYYAMKIGLYMRKNNYDIAHVHNFSQISFIIKLVSRKTQVVLHAHCEWLAQLDRRVLKRRMRNTDKIIGASKYIANGITDKHPYYKNKIHVLYNGIDKSGKSAKAENNRINILYVGRLSPEKGIHVMIESLKEVLSQNPNVYATFVGGFGLIPYEYMVGISDDPEIRSLNIFYGDTVEEIKEKRYVQRGKGYEQYVRKQAEPIKDHVNFAGTISHGDLEKYYAYADIFAFPSVCHEAFGMPVVEAMAYELPVVASKSGGVNEIVVNGETGLLVNRNNAGEFAEAIVEMINQPERRVKMGLAGKKRALECFRWDKIAENLLEIYTTYNNS